MIDEGLAREVTSRVQKLRKKLKLVLLSIIAVLVVLAILSILAIPAHIPAIFAHVHPFSFILCLSGLVQVPTDSLIAMFHVVKDDASTNITNVLTAHADTISTALDGHKVAVGEPTAEQQVYMHVLMVHI
jgi:hypothetical protein